MKQRVDHGILEVGAPPPGHKLIWPPTPPLLSQVGSHRLRQAFLHVHHRAVLVEHAHLDLPLECFYCHLFHATSPKTECIFASVWSTESGLEIQTVPFPFPGYLQYDRHENLVTLGLLTRQ